MRTESLRTEFCGQNRRCRRYSRRSACAPAGAAPFPCPPAAATANFLFDAQPNLFGIARQIKKSANFIHGLFAYRLAERRGFEHLKPFRGLLAFQAGQFNHSCTFPRIKKKNQPSDRLILCGERGIRTILPILNISTCYSEIKIKVHRITHR